MSRETTAVHARLQLAMDRAAKFMRVHKQFVI